MTDKDGKCMNSGCGCWDRLCPDNCAANVSGGDSSGCGSRTEAETESITTERRKELEDYKKEFNHEVIKGLEAEANKWWETALVRNTTITALQERIAELGKILGTIRNKAKLCEEARQKKWIVSSKECPIRDGCCPECNYLRWYYEQEEAIDKAIKASK